MKYTIKGYTSSNADFTDIIELPDGFDFDGLTNTLGFHGDPRYSSAWATFTDGLSDTSADSEYLEVFGECGFEVRSDLSNTPDQIVLMAESFGCDNCQDPDGDGSGNGDNEYTDGCDEDAPHGGFMITLDPLK